MSCGEGRAGLEQVSATGLPPEREAANAVSATCSDLVVRMARLMSDYGASVHEIEDAILELRAALDLRGELVLFNPVLFTSLAAQPGGGTVLVRFGPSQIDIDRLERVAAVRRAVLVGELAADAALDRLDRIALSPGRYGAAWSAVAWPLMAWGFAFIYQGSWREAACAALVSLLLMAINLRFPSNPLGTGLRLSVPLSAFAAGACAVLLSRLVHPLSVELTIVCSLVRFMPGYALVQAMTEIASHRLVSGTAHLADAMATVMILAMGVFLGVAAASAAVGSPLPYTPAAPSLPATAAAVAAASLAFLIAQRIAPRHLGFVLASCLAVTGTWIWGKGELGLVYGTGAAALLGALFANLHARLFRCSDLISKVPTAIILVPGVFCYRSVLEIIDGETVAGMAHFFTTFALAAAIIAAFLTVDILVPVDPGGDTGRTKR